MIRTDTEYKRSLQQLEEVRVHHHAQIDDLQARDVPQGASQIVLDASYTFLLSLQEDVEAYERAKRGVLMPLTSLSDIGRWLVHVRIAHGLTQKQLAERLGVSEAQVSRDERNEYHGISVDRAQAILDNMDVRFRIEEVLPTPTDDGEGNAALPSPPVSTPAVFGYLRAKKNLSPEKAAEVARVLNAVYESLTVDAPSEPFKE